MHDKVQPQMVSRPLFLDLGPSAWSFKRIIEGLFLSFFVLFDSFFSLLSIVKIAEEMNFSVC